ncbi:T9SS type A sorting domain-containing protein [Chitinophagaceae bacterium MMS25-I14]
MPKHLYLSVFFLAACCCKADAQIVPYTKTINAAGGSAVISTNVYEWSVGEMSLVNTASTSSLVVTQGVLQPYIARTSVATSSGLPGEINVFPNPAQSKLQVQYSFNEPGTVAYSLLDIAGREILKNSDETPAVKGSATIDVAAIASGHYILNVFFRPVSGAAQQYISFKIEKN